MALLLGIDAGTTSVKAGLFDPEGRCLGVARQEYQLSTPRPDWAELDPVVYWRACLRTTHDVLRASGATPDEVIALSVSSQGETVIAVDAAGQPVYPAIVWLDNRASEQARILSEKFGHDAYRVTGIPEVIPTWTACKIRWLRDNAPQAFARAAKFLLVQDYLVWQLTGQYATNGSIACTSLYFDIVQGTWWQAVLGEIGIGSSQLPQLTQAGTHIANLSQEASEHLGLPTSVQVVGGGMDQSVGAIGAGNIRPGIVSETTGAALTIQATITSGDTDPNQVVPVYRHSVPGSYLFVPVCPTAGMAYKWFKDTFGTGQTNGSSQDDSAAYQMLNDLAAQAPPGCDGLVMLPHLMGAYSPDPNPLARGSFTGFTLSHGRSHFARAIQEGVAFLLKRNLEALERAGIKVQEIRSTGGGARSALWNQIKANVAGVPVITLETEETALLGNAILAGIASGVFRSIAEGCAAMVATKERIPPNQEVGQYADYYRRYCDLDAVLADYYRRQYAD
jgi:sugar (pentulose or hexulose) kinase